MKWTDILQDERYTTALPEEKRAIFEDWYDNTIRTDPRYLPELESQIRNDLLTTPPPTPPLTPEQATERAVGLEPVQEAFKGFAEGYGAPPPQQPVDLTIPEEGALRVAPPKTIMDRITEVVARPFIRSREEEIARSQNIYAISEELELPRDVVSKNYNKLTRELGFKDEFTPVKLLETAIMFPIVAGAITAPGLTALGVGGFMALSEIESFVINKIKGEDYKFLQQKGLKELLPEEANEFTRDMVDIIDFIAKAATLGGIKAKAPKLFNKFTKDITTNYKLPRELYISPEKVKSSFKLEKDISKFELQMLRDLGMSAKEYRVALQKGVSVKVPVEKVTTIADKPYWAKLKSLFNVKPFEEIRVARPGPARPTVAFLPAPAKPTKPVTAFKPIARPPIAPEAPIKQPWQMTKGKYLEQQKQELLKIPKPAREQIVKQAATALGYKGEMERTHRLSVKQAFVEGKPIAKEVLADYPELAKPPVKPEVKEVKEIKVRKKPVYNIEKAVDKHDFRTLIKAGNVKFPAELAKNFAPEEVKKTQLLFSKEGTSLDKYAQELATTHPELGIKTGDDLWRKAIQQTGQITKTSKELAIEAEIEYNKLIQEEAEYAETEKIKATEIKSLERDAKKEVQGEVALQYGEDITEEAMKFDPAEFEKATIIEKTKAGEQILMPGAPERVVPTEKIKPKPGVKIKEEPLFELKKAKLGKQQKELFEPAKREPEEAGFIKISGQLEGLKKAKDKLITAIDVEYPFKQMGAAKTGLQIKTILSKRATGEEKALLAVKGLGKFKLSKQDFSELAFVSERPGKFVQLSPEMRKKYSPAYKHIRKYFDDYWKVLNKRLPEKFQLPWPKSRIMRNMGEVSHLTETIRKTHTKEYQDLYNRKFLKKSPEDRRTELSARIKELKAENTFLKSKKIQFVHIPVRLWLADKLDKNPALYKQLISGTFKGILGRETLTIDHLVQAGMVSKGDVDIRDIMASYGRYVDNQLAQLDILDMAKAEGKAKFIGEAPDDWVELPVRMAPALKGYKLEPVFAEALEKYFESLKSSGHAISRFMAIAKMFQFINPLFLPMYDVVQAGMLGSLFTPKMPLYLARGIRDVAKKTPAYFEAYEKGLFSTPFTNPFAQFQKDVDKIKKLQDNSGNYLLQALDKVKEDLIIPVKETIQFKPGVLKIPYNIIKDIYNLNWGVAWGMDKVIRMMSYNYLLDKGFMPEEAAQLAAKFHADYSSVPPETRKLMNKIWFTPTFEIVMNKLYVEMIKNAIQLPFKTEHKSLIDMGKIKGTDPTVYEMKKKKIFARGLLYMAGILFGKDALITRGLGFERQQFSRRYFSEFQDEQDQTKEVVLVFANPANLWNRYYYSFKPSESDTNILERTTRFFRYKLHPVYQLGIELAQNKRRDFKPVYNPFDDPEYIVADILKYSTGRIVRLTEEILKGGEDVTAQESFKALQQATNELWGWTLRPITFRYIRNLKDRRKAYELRKVTNEFEKYIIKATDIGSETWQKRIENYQKKMERISEQ